MSKAEHPIRGEHARPRREAQTSPAVPPGAPATESSPGPTSIRGDLWPGPRYARLVERLKTWIGRQVHVSIFSFNGSFLKEGQSYRLLDVIPYPAPQSHPHPAKRAYPHMLVLGSERPDDRDDAYWRNGVLHGGAINLAHVGSVTVSAFPEAPEDWIYGNLDLLSRYYGRPAAALLEDGSLPADALMAAPDSVWLTADDRRRIAGLLASS